MTKKTQKTRIILGILVAVVGGWFLFKKINEGK